MKILLVYNNVNPNSYDIETITAFRWPAMNCLSVGFSFDCYTHRQLLKDIMFSVRKAIREAAS